MKKTILILMVVILLSSFAYATEMNYEVEGNLSLSNNPTSAYNINESVVYQLGFNNSNQYDSTGNNRNGTLSQSTYMNNQLFNGGYYFNGGGNDYITYEGNMITSYPFTLNVFFNTTDSGNGVNIITLANKSVGDIYYAIDMAQGKVRLTSSNTAFKGLTSANRYNDSDWHMATAIFNNNTNKTLYIDGVYEGTLTDSVTYAQTDRLALGVHARLQLDKDWEGYIDSSSVFNTSLTDIEVKQIWNNSQNLDMQLLGNESAKGWCSDNNYNYQFNVTNVTNTSIELSINGTNQVMGHTIWINPSDCLGISEMKVCANNSNVFTIACQNPPAPNVVLLNSSGTITDSTPQICFNMTSNSSASASCTLYNGTIPYGTNATSLNNTATCIITNTTLTGNTNYTDVHVNCTDTFGSETESSSIWLFIPSALNFDIYDFGLEWGLINFSSYNYSNMNDSFCHNPHEFGHIYFHNDTTGNVTALTEDVWNNITAFDQGENGQVLNGVSYSSSVLTIDYEGIYSVFSRASFTGTANNKYHLAIGVNGIEQDRTENHDRISTGSDVLNIIAEGYLQLNKDDEITLMIMNEDSGGDATILSAGISVKKEQDIPSHSCNISTDNSTWVDITSIAYSGCISEIDNIAYIQNLDEDTTYYVRCKTPQSLYGYSSFKTNAGGINQMEIAIVMILIGISAVMMYVGLNSESKLLGMLFKAVSFIMMLLGINAGTNLDGISATLRNTLEIGFIVLLFGGLLFFVIYTIVLFLSNVFANKKRMSIGEYDEED